MNAQPNSAINKIKDLNSVYFNNIINNIIKNFEFTKIGFSSNK